MNSNFAITRTITRKQLDENERIEYPAQIFGIQFPLNIEPTVYAMAGMLSADYDGGHWAFYLLGNGGFYMVPGTETPYPVSAMNGYDGILSADALGITACLYAYSHLSFSRSEGLAEVCAKQYHLLREYAMEHPEVGAILATID